MVIAPGDWSDWLDPANNQKELMLGVMHPAMSSGPGGLTTRPVSTEVNSVRNNGPDLIKPLADAEGPAAISMSAANPATSINERGLAAERRAGFGCAGLPTSSE